MIKQSGEEIMLTAIVLYSCMDMTCKTAATVYGKPRNLIVRLLWEPEDIPRNEKHRPSDDESTNDDGMVLMVVAVSIYQRLARAGMNTNKV